MPYIMKRIFLFSCFLFSILVSNAQIITTVAGNGSYGFSGDNGPAIAAAMNDPIAVAVDKFGNIFIADTYNSRVRRIDANTKIISTVAGNGNFGFSGDGGLAINAELYNPLGLAIDFDGNLYISDSYNNRIRKVDLNTGLISTLVGTGVGNFSGDGGNAIHANISNPIGLAFDDQNRLYIVDEGNSRIRRVDLVDSVITTIAGGGIGNFTDGVLASLATLNRPYYISIDSIGNYYFTDDDSRLVKYVNVKTGLMYTLIGNGRGGRTNLDSLAIHTSLDGPTGIVCDKKSNLFFSDSDFVYKYSINTKALEVIAGNSNYTFSGDGFLATHASIVNPVGLAIDYSGNLFIADVGHNRIREIIHNPICDQFHIKPVTVLDPTLIDSCNGAIGLSLVGGNAPYQFVISPNDTIRGSVANLTKLCSGQYNVVLTDSNGCMADTSITLAPIYSCVNSTLKVGVSKYSVPTNKLCNGRLSATGTGGKKPFQYHWSDGFAGAVDTTLCALKTYTVSVVDSIGCVATTQFTTGKDSVTLPCLGFSVNIGSQKMLSSCYGTATANIIGGTAPYLYSWSNYYNTPSIDGICPGLYFVQVIDANGCITTASTNIAPDTTSTPSPLSVYVNTSYASTPSTCNGVAVASAEGGISPYKYAFSNKNSYLNYDSLLCSGVYQVTVTDKKGIQATMTFVISNPMNSFGDSTTQYTDSFAIATPNASAATNCFINYPTVDSVAIINYQMIGAGHDSVLITWAIFSGQTYTPIGMKYAIGKSGVYDFVLQIYCGPTITAKMNANVVNGYLTAHEKYYINTSATGITSISPSGNASSIYPVPFTSNLTVRFGNPDRYNVTIMDLTGKTVINPIMNNTNPECMINLTNLEAGVYMVKVQSSKGGVEFFKAIKN